MLAVQRGKPPQTRQEPLFEKPLISHKTSQCEPFHRWKGISQLVRDHFQLALIVGQSISRLGQMDPFAQLADWR